MSVRCTGEHMQTTAATSSMSARLTQDYSAATDALSEIGRAYCNLGKLAEAQRVLQTALTLIEADAAQPHNRLKLLLEYARVLIISQLAIGTDGKLAFSALEQARQIADS